MNRTIPAGLARLAALLVVLLGASSTLPAAALSNPSQVQYGYDPIVDPGSTEPEPSGMKPASPEEKVQEATAVVEEITYAEPEPADSGGVTASAQARKQPPKERPEGRDRSEQGVLSGIPSGQDASGDQGGLLSSNSWWFIGALLVLTLGLVAWAIARGRRIGRPATVDLVVRSASLVVFVILLIVLNGSGSLLS